MPKNAPLQYGQYYHIYNRGNNREDIFCEERSYRYFLQLLAKYICRTADLTDFPADASSDPVRSVGTHQV